jgi:hypothetical protein
MKIHHCTLSNNHAISEIVGSVILLLIAVLSFSAIYLYVFPLPGYSAESNVDIQGSVSGQIPELIHVGGETLQEYQIFVDESVYKDKESPDGIRYNWKMGEKRPLDEKELKKYDKRVDVMVISKTEDGGSQIVFEGEFDNPFYNEPPTQDTPSFNSTLGNNTTGEDLICYKNGQDSDPEGESVTYIYAWFKNNVSFASLYLPCNTDSSVFTKDYTSSKNNGMVENANWTKNGQVGGGYSFDGDGSITCDIPEQFNNISNEEFSITTWIQSSNINEDYNCVLEAYADNQNYVQIFQYNRSIYADVCSENGTSILKSNVLNSSEWYHIGITWNGTSLKLYVNGSEFHNPTGESFFSSGNERLSIGQKTDGTFGWNGSIDEIYVYDIAVSEDHIYQQYLCTQEGSSNVSVIVSEETTSGETWYCDVTPNDGHQDGETKREDSIVIIE